MFGDEKRKSSDLVTFTEMTEGTRKDWEIIMREIERYGAGLSERILAHLRLLRGEPLGFRVDQLEHALQTATRAFRDGRDEEYVVCALLHDIGDSLATYNHADFAATILKPFVSERNHWMIQHHGIFQGYYYFDFVDRDRNMRERFRGHSHFDYTAQFCEYYDQNSFDPGYASMPLEAFEPMVRNVFKEMKNPTFPRKTQG
ncbi:HD domain-containing protein [Bradyrhizobium sp. USDA 4486]